MTIWAGHAVIEYFGVELAAQAMKKRKPLGRTRIVEIRPTGGGRLHADVYCVLEFKCQTGEHIGGSARIPCTVV